jgi:hypothetical protein
MSTVTGEKLQEGQEQELASAPATDGLVELGAVSDTKGGILGWFQDIGNGWSFSF